MKRIAELRKAAGLNQIGLALKLNVSQKMISAYETGIHQPSVEILMQLSKIFNVSIDYITENSDIKASADSFLQQGLTKQEIEMLDLFKQLDSTDKTKAIGIVFALLNYKA